MILPSSLIILNVIAYLVGNPNVEALDVSWNSLDTLAFKRLGKALVKHQKLRSLGISNTTPSRDVEIDGSPLLLFLEFLAFDGTLVSLPMAQTSQDTGPRATHTHTHQVGDHTLC